ADRVRCDRMDGGATGVTAASHRWQRAPDWRLFVLALSDPAEKRFWAAFLEGLREYGWVEGQNLLIEGRWAEGHPEASSSPAFAKPWPCSPAIRRRAGAGCGRS